jgi:chitodextrinase
VVFDNYGTAGRDNFIANVREMYDLFTTTSNTVHDYLSKPWGIAEWNIRKGNLAWQQTYDYYDDARAAVENGVFPRIKAYMIYDSIGPDGNENRVGYQAGGVLDPVKQQHYTAFAQSSAFQDSPSPPGDTTAPTVTLTAPSDGSIHQGDVTVTADVEDDTAVSQVSLVVDGAPVAPASTPTGSVAAFRWDSTTVDDGEHQIQVRAIDSAGNSAVSASVNIRVANNSPGGDDTEAPATPVAQVTSATADGVTLSWTRSEDNVGVVSYEIARDGVLLAATSERTYTDARVRQGASYSYTVVAVDRAGNRSQSSAAVNATIADTTAPSTPATPTGRLSTNSSIDLTWPAAMDNVGISGYEVWRDGSLLGNTTQSSYTDTACVQGKAYSYRVAAIDTSNNRSALSPATAPIAVPDVTAPTAPTQLAGTTPTRRTVVLRWRAATDNVGVASYLIYRDSSRIATVSGTTLTYTVSSLRSGSTYRFSVRAVDGAGNVGPMSTVISVRAT